MKKLGIIEKITSFSNPKIKGLKSLQKDNNFFWWEGVRFFEEVVKENIHCEIIVTCKDDELESLQNISDKIMFVTPALFESLSFTKNSQGIGGIIKIPEIPFEKLVSESKNIFYLAGLQDPGNVGTIVRIADAFGFGGLVYEQTGASPYSEKAVRASAGSILRVKTIKSYYTILDKLVDLGYSIFFLSNDYDAQNISKVHKDLSKKTVFVLGQEGSGINFSYANSKKIFIPISKNTESLNVAVCAGIVGFYSTTGRED